MTDISWTLECLFVREWPTYHRCVYRFDDHMIFPIASYICTYIVRITLLRPFLAIYSYLKLCFRIPQFHLFV